MLTKTDLLLQEARAEIERLERCGSITYADLVRRLVRAWELDYNAARDKALEIEEMRYDT